MTIIFKRRGRGLRARVWTDCKPFRLLREYVTWPITDSSERPEQ